MKLADQARGVQDRYAYLDALEPLNFWLMDRHYDSTSRWRILHAAHETRSLERVADDGTLGREDVDAAYEVLRRCLLPAGEQPREWADILEATDRSSFPCYRALLRELLDADGPDDWEIDETIDEERYPFLASA